MTAVPKKKLTVAEYLAIEEKAEFKSEFYDGEVFAMSGGTPDHCTIKDNLVVEIGARLKGGPCRSYSSDLRVLVDRTGLYTYPDIVLVCGGPEFSPDDPNTLVNPRVIVEVLSPSTEGYDRGTKFTHYRQVASLQVYVLVEQDEPRIEQYVRQPDGSWNLQTFAGLEAAFPLAGVPAAPVPLADVYRDVAFPPSPPLR